MRARLARSLFFYYSLYNGRGIFHSEDVCQVRMVAPRFIFHPHLQLLEPAATKMWPKNVEKSNIWVVSYPHLSPQESWWKTNLVIVRSRGTGASPVLGHCKSRKCSKLSRFWLDWSQPKPLIRVDQFINISRESLKISTSGVCVNIFSIQCKVVPNPHLIPDFTCHEGEWRMDECQQWDRRHRCISV